jgi:hypothetical protein
MARKTSGTAAPIYQLKIVLDDLEPAVWRRLPVRGDVLLGQLHGIIQWTMGWEDCHMHEFRTDDARYGASDPEADDQSAQSEDRIALRQVAPRAGAVIRYWYDFGDDWRHTITVEEVLEPDPAHKHPRCVAGENACPPEDCGGIFGYMRMLEVLTDPGHPEHAYYLERLGDEFDPRHFDIDAVNRALQRMKG